MWIPCGHNVDTPLPHPQMNNEKKEQVIRARVGETLRKQFRKYCKEISRANRLEDITEANILRKALAEYMENHPIEKEEAA